MKKAKMTVMDVISEMREYGMNISIKTFTLGIDKGFFPFVHVLSIGESGRRSYLILRKEYEEWAKEYLYFSDPHKS